MAATDPSVATFSVSRGRPLSTAGAEDAAGQVIPASVQPELNTTGNSTAAAPAGQRPNAGTAASSAHETRPAGMPRGTPSTGPVKRSPGAACTSTIPCTPAIWCSLASSAAVGAAATPGGP